MNKFGCYELNSGDRIGLAIPSGYTISGLEPENCFSFRILKIHELEKALEIGWYKKKCKVKKPFYNKTYFTDNDDSIILETPVDKLGPKKHSKCK